MMTSYPLLLMFGVAWWSGFAFWYARQPAASAYHPATYYLFFHGVLFVLRPILAYLQHFRSMYRALEFEPSLSDKLTALGAADLAMAVFVLVSVRVAHQPFTRAAPSQRGAPPRFDRSFWLTIALCLPLALLSLWSGLAGRVSSETTMVFSESGGRLVNTTGNGYFSDALLMLVPLVVLFAWAGRFRFWALAPLLLFVLVKAGTGGRWPFVMAALSCFSLYMYERRLRWPPARIFIAAVPLVLLFTAIGADRGQAIRQVIYGEQAVRSDFSYFAERPLEPMDYANMEFLEFLVHVVPARTGTYDYFLDNLMLFTEPVPRVLWPGKPGGPPFQRIFLSRYAPVLGITVALPGEGWQAAGWIGVALWAALFALIYAVIYNRYVASAQDRVRTALFMIFMPMSLQCFRDGTLLTMFKMSLFTLLPVLIWRALQRFDRPAS